jgi:hypothetical protein
MPMAFGDTVFIETSSPDTHPNKDGAPSAQTPSKFLHSMLSSLKKV